MKTFRNFLSIVFGVTLLGGVMLGTDYAIVYLMNVFANLEHQIKTNAIFASVIALPCFALQLYQVG